VRSMYCPRCAKENDEGARFCRQCGLNLRLIPEALEGTSSIRKATVGWWRPAGLALFGILFCAVVAAMALSYDGLDVRSGLSVVGMYLQTVAMFVMGAVMAYFKLHPSVQIGYHQRIQELALGFAAVFGSVGVLIGSQAVGMPMLGIILAIVLLVAGVPPIVIAGRAVVGAQRRAGEEAEDEEDEEDEPSPAVGEHRAQRERWLQAPPSVVSTPFDLPDVVVPEDEIDTAKLPPKSVRE
jgi:hypothetical protein